MNYGKEFKKFATKKHGVNSLYYDKLVGSLTPYIIEERQLNISQLDVFSRLMMDRIIFMGTGWSPHPDSDFHVYANFHVYTHRIGNSNVYQN